MPAKRANTGTPSKPRRPATTPEAREQQLGSYAYDLAEKQLLDGSASAQVITYFLKANSVRERKEIARLEYETELTRAKVGQAGQADRMETLLENAMKAFTTYQGGEIEDDEDDY